MKATWNGTVLADSSDTVIIEGNHYFPPGSVDTSFLKPSQLVTSCHWKGGANYYDLQKGETTVENGAWYYPAPKDGSTDKVGSNFTNYVAFYGNYVDIS